MEKRWIMAALLLASQAAFAISVNVIVPYEESEKPAPKKPMTDAQKQQEAIFQERIRQRDAQRQEAQKAHDEFVKQQREKHEAQARERQKAAQELQHSRKQ